MRRSDEPDLEVSGISYADPGVSIDLTATRSLSPGGSIAFAPGLGAIKPNDTDQSLAVANNFKSQILKINNVDWTMHRQEYLLVFSMTYVTAVETKSALAAKQWIQRIVVGTIGVEVASSLVGILTSSVPAR